MKSRRRTSGWAALVAVTAAATALSTTGAADATSGGHRAPAAPVAQPHSIQAAHSTPAAPHGTGRFAVFVQFAGGGAADAAQRSGSARVALDRKAAVRRQSSSVLARVRAADAKATSMFVVSNSVPGMGVMTDAAGAAALASTSGVVKVSRILPKTFENANAANLIKAIQSWKFAGGTGKGVNVGVIDTGLDYTHADFGGAGTPEAYAAASSTDPSWRAGLSALGKAKVKGGYDFAGDAYNADPSAPSYNPVPSPDSNPLDCGEHGTHVAGTATGYGVTDTGATFTGSYASLDASTLMGMKVGPGMAPQANLYALKVFGCEGSTDVVIPALDWALDPNGDGKFGDHLDIVNLSLGSSYGNEDDPENTVINALAKHGVLSVISMGNNGDLTDTGGAPGNSVSALTAASSVDSFELLDGINVNAPADVLSTAKGQMSVAYDWANNGPTGAPVTGAVAAIPGTNEDGCDTLSAADAAKVAGKIAWLVWDDNDTTRRCGSVGRSGKVKAAGAIGAVFTSGLDVFGAGITGDATIPVFQFTGPETARLQAAVDSGTLILTFDGSLQATVKDQVPANTDTLSSFSSRGTHGSIGVVKPDIAAPGNTISSAAMGTGSGVVSFSGTSMAAPMTTGTAAIVAASHPTWGPLQIKAAVMNNAGHDVWTGQNQSGFKYAPARVGAGRIDALASRGASVLAYVNSPANAVSASFGPVPAPITAAKVTKTKTLKVTNTKSKPVTVKLAYEAVNASPGVSYVVSPASLTIPGNATRSATITMNIVPSKLRHTIDPTMEVSQLGLPRQFVSDASGRVLVTPKGGKALRVPVYGAAKPTSATTVSVSGSNLVIGGKGFNQGTGASAYTSMLSVMKLGATSPKLPSCGAGASPVGCVASRTDRSGDIAAVGAGATNDWLWFGVATHGDWVNIGNVVQPYVDFDVDGDGATDFETFVTNLTDTDVLVAVTVDAAGNTVDIEPVNFNLGDVDSNVFDSNVILLPVDKSTLGLPVDGTTSASLTYTVGTFYGYTGTDLDSVSVTDDFDAGAPTLTTSDPLFADTGAGATVPVTTTETGQDALVFHLHGAKGKRFEIVELP